LAAAQIIDPSTLEVGGRIVFGATVEIEDLENGKKVTYQIVGDDEADLKANKISISSPIARALIGKEEGDVATFSSPGGSREVEILNVKYI
jgi:transcription elongation factor GreA